MFHVFNVLFATPVYDELKGAIRIFLSECSDHEKSFVNERDLEAYENNEIWRLGARGEH